MPVQLQQPFANDQPQPQKQRIGGITQILVQPANGFDIGFLDHVGSVDASPQAAAQAQLDHAPQPSPVPGENLIYRRLVAAASALQKTGGVSGVIVHKRPHPVLTPARAVFGTTFFTSPKRKQRMPGASVSVPSTSLKF